MRLLSILRAVGLAAAFALPLGHAAFADAQQSSAAASMPEGGDRAGGVPMAGGGPYDNDFVMSPPIGD